MLLPFAGSLDDAHERLASLVTPELLSDIGALVPDDWLEPQRGRIGGPAEQREAYVRYLMIRAGARETLVDSIEEVRRAA